MNGVVVSSSDVETSHTAARSRVLLVDDYPILVSSLRGLLEGPEIEVVGEATRGREALEKIEAMRPDLVVLDCALPDISGVEVAAEIRRRGWPIRILVLSGFSHEQYVRGMTAARVEGYVLKEENLLRIREAVLAVIAGGRYFSQGVAVQMAACLGGYQAQEVHLTPREEQVLDLVAEGKSNEEIASALVVSERTVSFHVSNVLAKLKVGSRLEAAVLWTKRKLAH